MLSCRCEQFTHNCDLRDWTITTRMDEDDHPETGSGSSVRHAPPQTPAYIRYVEKSAEELYEIVEYDMDEEVMHLNTASTNRMN